MLVSLKKASSPCAGTLQEGGAEYRGRQSQGLVAVLRAGVNRPVDVERTSRDLSGATSSKAVWRQCTTRRQTSKVNRNPLRGFMGRHARARMAAAPVRCLAF